MRTTVDLDDDTAAAIERERRDEGIGLSEAVNRLIRRGLVREQKPGVFTQETRPMGLTVDVSKVAEALDLLEGTEAGSDVRARRRHHPPLRGG
jgi:hypothetical protein